MILPNAAWRARDGLPELADALGAREGTTRFVGGAVRDTLLGRAVSDVDLATRLSPPEVIQRVRDAGFRPVPTGLTHGTVTAVLPSGPVEVTTLRRDVATDGRHALVAFTDDWRADAARRDFTINALSAEPGTGALHDYFDGLADLAAARIRFIGDPGARIAEDHLRILRFFRFHARFGKGEPDARGLAACIDRADDLTTLSAERVAQELLKLLGATDPVPTARIMIARGILTPVLPQIDGGGARRLERLVAREEAMDEPSALRRLAALLPPDRRVAAQVAAGLKLSNAQRLRLENAAHRRADEDPRALAHAIGVEGARDQLLLYSSEAATGLARLAGWVPPRLPLGGGELIAMGLTPGPMVAATLRRVERCWVSEGFPDADRARAIAAEAVAQALRSASQA